MSLTSYYLGTGIGLLITLLAWGDQIRKPQEDLINLEKKYIDDLNLKKKDALPIIRSNSDYTFTQQMDSIIDLWDNEAIKKPEFALKDSIKSLNKIKKQLENCFIFRYFSIILFSLVNFILGILSVFSFSTKTAFTIYEVNVSINNVYFIIFFLYVLIIMFNLIYTYFKEKIFISSLYEALDKLD